MRHLFQKHSIQMEKSLMIKKIYISITLQIRK
jgi:hypothetical protein